MLMVVFGAGASYDSCADFPASLEREDGHPVYRKDYTNFQPRGISLPLASQLFELRVIFADAAQGLPECKIPISDLRNLKPEVSVEQQLQKMQEESPNYAEGQRQLISIRFYLQWIIRDCQKLWNDALRSHTTYTALVGQIDRQLKGEPACFVTFNYDTLLEEAFTSLRINFESLDDYVSRDTRKIIKLHGSTNWGHEVSTPMKFGTDDHLQFAKMLVGQEKLETNSNYHFIPEHFRRQQVTSFIRVADRHDPVAVLPAIAIPVEKKHSYECPPKHEEVLRECISKTDKLLIVGWRGAEENFVKLLTQGLGKGIPKMVVSRNEQSADEIGLRLRGSGMSGESWSSGKAGFTEEVRSGRIERFIER